MKKNFKHLVVGATYKDREGREYGPMIESGNGIYPFKCSMTGGVWTDKGRYDVSCKSRFDLVELVSLPETQAQKRKVTDLGPNEVIHCATEAEDKAIRELLHAAGKKWSSGQSYLELTYWPGSDCYRPAGGQTDTLLYYKEDRRTIYPASDFLPVGAEAEPKQIFVPGIVQLRNGKRVSVGPNNDYSWPLISEMGVAYHEDGTRGLYGIDEHDIVHQISVADTGAPLSESHASAPYWMVHIEGSGEPTFRHPTQVLALVEAERLLAKLSPRYKKAIVTKHNATVEVATVEMVLRPETKYTDAADYKPEDDLPF